MRVLSMYFNHQDNLKLFNPRSQVAKDLNKQLAPGRHRRRQHERLKADQASKQKHLPTTAVKHSEEHIVVVLSKEDAAAKELAGARMWCGRIKPYAISTSGKIFPVFVVDLVS